MVTATPTLLQQLPIVAQADAEGLQELLGPTAPSGEVKALTNGDKFTKVMGMIMEYNGEMG